VSRGVEPGHELAVGGPGGVEVLVAFLELQPQVDDVLLEVDDPLVELVDVVGCAEPGLAPGLLAEQFGQPFLELLGACGQAGAALLGGQQVGLQRGSADRGPDAGGVRRLGFGGVDLFEQVGVPVEEGAVDPGFSELRMIMDLRWAAAPFARSTEDGGYHQVDVVMVEPGEGVAEIHRDSVGKAGRKSQDSLFTSGTGQVAGVERGDGGRPVDHGHFGDAVGDAGAEVDESLGEAVAAQEVSVVDEEIGGGFEAVETMGLGP